MSYEPLHHKYRPQTFAQLVGQEAIARTLANAIAQNKIVPAYLFTGPRGTGKTSSARILAKSLNCISSQVPTAQPCGVCDVCQEIAKGSSVDVMEIDAASNTGVDNIRELIERAQFAPARCRYKVYCIDECHMLSNAAFNALLKTLEEPPDRVVFVLATTDPQRVLPTIISRCQQFDFRRIRLEEMVRHLNKIAERENIAIAREAIALVAQLSQGGLRDAESLLDQLSLVEGEVTPELVWELVGSVSEQEAIALLQAISDRDPLAVVQQCRAIVDRGREPLILLQNLTSFYRDLVIAKTAPERHDLVAVTSATWRQLIKLAQQWEVASILAAGQHLRTCEVQIKNTTQPRLWLEVALLGLLSSNTNSTVLSTVSTVVSTTKIKPEDGQKKTHQEQMPRDKTALGYSESVSEGEVAPPTSNSVGRSQPSPTQKNDSPPEQIHQVSAEVEETPEEPSVSNDKPQIEANVESTPSVSQSTDLDRVWQQVIDRVKLNATRTLLTQHGHLLDIQNAVVTVRVATAPLLRMVEKNLSTVEMAFAEVLKHPVKVKLVLPSTSQSESIEQKTLTSSINLPDSPDSNITNSLDSQEELVDFQQEEENICFETPLVTETAIASPKDSCEIDRRRQEEQLVTEAAQSFAKTFNGEAIALPEALDILKARTVSNTLSPEKGQPINDADLQSNTEDWAEDDDDDIPF